jgi:integrase/recombinase XerD
VSDVCVVNRARNLRARAKSIGLTVSKQGELVTVFDDAGLPSTTGSLEQVEAWIAERFVRRSPGPGAEQIPASWRPWIQMFIAEQDAARRSPNTIQTRVVRLAHFAREHPDSDPLTVTRAELIAYMANPAWSPQTAHNVRSTLRLFFRMLYELAHRRDNPAQTLPSIALPRAMPRPCPDHAVFQAMAATENQQVALAIRIGVQTGMRRSEIARLRPTDVIGQAGNYWVHITGKGGHQRAVPISDELADQLAAIPTTYVFPNRTTGGPVTPRHLGKLVAAALPGEWTAHTLRHRFATTAYAAERDLRAVQELLGHVSPVTTAIYTKVADESMRRAAAATRLNV